MPAMTPYEILGVSPNASIEVVRAAYIQLARQHHPDKHGHASEEERKRHETIFKDVTNAYQSIMKTLHDQGTPGTGAWQIPTSLDEWESTWNKVMNVPEVMKTMKSLFNMAKQMREARQRAASAEECVLRATLQVTPADVQDGRKRKIRVLPSGTSVAVDCGVFPAPFCDDDANVEVAFEIVSKDAEVTVDSFEQGKWDLFRRLSVNLVEWFEGSVHEIPHVSAHGPMFTVVVPPCASLETPLIFNDASQWRFGNIYISIALDLPKQSSWEGLEEVDRKRFLALLRALSQPVPVP